MTSMKILTPVMLLSAALVAAQIPTYASAAEPSTGSVGSGSFTPGPAGPPVRVQGERGAAPLAQSLLVKPCGATASDDAIARSLAGRVKTNRMNSMDADQVACARLIVTATQAFKLSARAAQLALMTAMTESTLHNFLGGDRDSEGLFQQRPSQGWGTVAQVTDPTYATQTFLRAMQSRFPNQSWQSGDMGAICQRVQGSAFPAEYAKAEQAAGVVLNALWTTVASGAVASGAVAGQPDGDRVFFTNAAGQIEQNWIAAGRWRGPSAVAAAKTTGRISVQSGGKNIFYTDAASGRVGTAWSGSGGWRNSVLPGSGTDPTVAPAVNGVVRVFFRDSAGRILNDAYSRGQWKSGGQVGTAVSRGPVSVSTDGRTLFYTDASDRVGIAWLTSTGWRNSVLAGSGTQFAAVKAGNFTQVFYRAPNGRIGVQWNSGKGWSGPSTVGAVTTNGPISAQSNGTSIFFTDGGTGRVATGWRLATGVWKTGAIPGSGINTSVSTAPGQLRRVFFRGTDGTIQDDYYSSTGWHGPTAIGGGN